MLNFTDFLWSYKISVSVQIYRDCNLQRKCGHLTEILPTFLKSVNGSSLPVYIFFISNENCHSGVVRPWSLGLS